ncbi:hypothetical protein [Mesonia maritima]|uniref:Uncharacterized protein n=1 Tax=Mesonia maritima TaxID=1793873 RepID=A0ABU1K7R1_9FLAO|nr:hypothetical protein [Mesonia maritima]MDR6301062.1 hypothetical protein [Mesonia maritima]
MIDVSLEENLETNLGKLQVLYEEMDIILQKIKDGLNEKFEKSRKNKK